MESLCYNCLLTRRGKSFFHSIFQRLKFNVAEIASRRSPAIHPRSRDSDLRLWRSVGAGCQFEKYAEIAQVVERRPEKPGVASASLALGILFCSSVFPSPSFRGSRTDTFEPQPFSCKECML